MMASPAGHEAHGRHAAPGRGGWHGAWRGALAGLVPLGVLVVALALTLVATAVARNLTAAQGFFAQQRVIVGVVVVGMIAAVLAYAVACWLTLRRAGKWQRAGERWRAAAALVMLLLTALVVALPAVLALVVSSRGAPA